LVSGFCLCSVCGCSTDTGNLAVCEPEAYRFRGGHSNSVSVIDSNTDALFERNGNRKRAAEFDS
jgi:hypothetical protein